MNLKPKAHASVWDRGVYHPRVQPWSAIPARIGVFDRFFVSAFFFCGTFTIK